jgi:hypothetical protein
MASGPTARSAIGCPTNLCKNSNRSLYINLGLIGERVSVMTSALVKRLLTAVMFTVASTGLCANWVVLQSIEPRISARSVDWRAQLMEENLPEKRSLSRVGNAGESENWNRRMLVIEVASEAPGRSTRRQEYEIPSRTVSGDPCSVRSVELAEQDALLGLTVTYDFGCGAGSSTSVFYKIDVQPDANTLTYLQWDQASRDEMTSIEVDYAIGRISSLRGRSEDECAENPVVQSFKKGAVVLDRRSLLRCPHPLRGNRIESCRA